MGKVVEQGKWMEPLHILRYRRAFQTFQSWTPLAQCTFTQNKREMISRGTRLAVICFSNGVIDQVFYFWIVQWSITLTHHPGRRVWISALYKVLGHLCRHDWLCLMKPWDGLAPQLGNSCLLPRPNATLTRIKQPTIMQFQPSANLQRINK